MFQNRVDCRDPINLVYDDLMVSVVSPGGFGSMLLGAESEIPFIAIATAYLRGRKVRDEG